MNILGIGPLELIFIIIIMILVLGPQQMVTTARKAGVYIRKIVKSPMWGTIMDTSREIRDIPTRLVREAGLEEDLREIRSSTQSIKDLKNISVSIDPISVSDRKAAPVKLAESVPVTPEEVKVESGAGDDSQDETSPDVVSQVGPVSETDMSGQENPQPPAENTAADTDEMKNQDLKQ